MNLSSQLHINWAFPGESVGKESACNVGDPVLTPKLGRFTGKVNGNPLQSSCLENSTDRETWWATVHGSQRVGHDWATSLHSLHTLSLEKEMATHSSVLAWRIPCTGVLAGHGPWGRRESDTTNWSDWAYTRVGRSLSSKEQGSFNFMTAITVCSDFGDKKIKSVIVSIVSPSISHEAMGPDKIS